MFDTQVEKIDALIQEQLRRIKQDHPHEEVVSIPNSLHAYRVLQWRTY